MSRPRHGWWSYAKYMIRQYPALKSRLEELQSQSVTANLSGMPHGGGVSDPTADAATRELPPEKQREFEAVRGAVESTLAHKGTGRERLELIRLVYWANTHTLEGAALKLHISPRTAQRWNAEFVYLTGEKAGFMKKMASQSHENVLN